MSNTLLTQLFGQYPLHSLPAQTVLLREQESVTHYYWLQKGVVRMSVSAANGKTVVLHLFFPGSLFPLLSLAGQDQQHYELEALTPIEVRMIPFAVFQKQLKSHPELSYLLLTRLAAGLDRMTLRLQQNLSNTPQQQLASLLLYFVRHQEHSTNSSPLITITHQDLADWLGLSRENVSLQLGKLVAQGILKTGHGWISVTNLVALQKLTT